MKQIRPIFLLLLFLFALFFAACQVIEITPPRLNNTPQLPPTAVPLISQAPTPTAVFDNLDLEAPVINTPTNRSTLTVWVNETSTEHEQLLDDLIAEFSQAEGIDVELQLVSPMILPELMHTAIISSEFPIPDIVIHSLENSVGWADQGVLNLPLTNEIIDGLGRNTFNADALELVEYRGQTAVIPIHGHHQIILYRADWFAEQGLPMPDNYDTLFAGAEAFFNPETYTSGFVVPTESNLITTYHGFEHLALANGCQLLTNEAEVIILDPACRDALDFYYNIVHNFSPSGVQTDSSAWAAYLAGRTAIIITSPSILPQLAGLNGTQPCPECRTNSSYLAQNSGILTHIGGISETVPVNLGKITNMAITHEADEETAVAFANFWFNTVYPTWIAIETERKVPMRLGNTNNPSQFINNWGIIPLGNSNQSLTDIYGADIVAQLRDNIATSPRWGYRQGQGAIMSELSRSNTFPVVLQELLSGYFNTNKTIFEAYNRVIEFIPSYTFPIEPTPTPEP